MAAIILQLPMRLIDVFHRFVEIAMDTTLAFCSHYCEPLHLGLAMEPISRNCFADQTEPLVGVMVKAELSFVESFDVVL